MACSTHPLDEDFAGALPAYLVGIVQATPGTVVVFDDTGAAVLASSAVGVVSLNSAVVCHRGVVIVTTGGAVGSLLLEG